MEAVHLYEDCGQRREYSRVEAYLPFEYRIVAQEEREHIQSRISGVTNTAEFRPVQDLVDHDHILGEWLKMLNTKLDTVIRLITLQREGYFGLSYKTVSISGGGMSFTLPEAVSVGKILEFKIMLTWNQPLAMCIYGEVTKSIQQGQAHLTAVKYVHMDASIRDEIIRFVFEREREIIREKRG